MSDFLIGDKNVLKILDKLPNNLGKRAVTSSARVAAKPIVRTARNLLLIHKKGSGEGGFSKLLQVVRSTKVVSSRSKTGGVNVVVKGRDIPVGSRFWTVRGYAQLLADGASRITGRFEGYRDWIVRAGNLHKLSTRRIFVNALLPQVKKAIERTKNRYGLKR